MIKTLKIGLMILASVFMGAIMWFLDDVSVIDAVSASYFLVVNGFLGVDLAHMIRSSAKMPAGEYKDMKFSKYIISFILMIILFGISVYRKEACQVNAVVAMSSFSAGGMLILGHVMVGLGGNSIARTMGEPKQ